MKKALLLVDVQNDFLPGGSMGVEGGDLIIPKLNHLLTMPFDVVITTKDWHPPGHVSFAKRHDKEVGEIILWHGEEQKLWPDHCIQKSWGADFPPTLEIDRFPHFLIRKGEDPEIDSYSGFFDNHREKKTELDAILLKEEVKEIFIAGLTTDYCVLFTASDGIEMGYTTYVILDACKGIDVRPGDVDKAIQTMKEQGVECIQLKDVQKMFSSKKKG